MKNLRDYIPENVADGTPGLRNALAALSYGEKLFCPAGAYYFFPPTDGTDYIAKRVGSFYMEGEGFGTQFCLANSEDAIFPPTMDFLRVESSVEVLETGFGLSNFYVQTMGRSRHAINIAANPAGLSGFYISGLHLAATNDSTLKAASLGYSVIEKCNIHSIDLVTMGDGVRVQDCILNSIRYAGVDGAAGFVLRDNVIAGTGIMLDVQKAVNPAIVNNEFETPYQQPTTSGCCLSFGTPELAVLTPQIVGNSISVLPGTEDPIPVILNNTYFANVDGGFMHILDGNHIYMGPKAVNTRIGRSTWYRKNGVDQDYPVIGNKRPSTKFVKLINTPDAWF